MQGHFSETLSDGLSRIRFVLFCAVSDGFREQVGKISSSLSQNTLNIF